jgi:hypothetical protein
VNVHLPVKVEGAEDGAFTVTMLSTAGGCLEGCTAAGCEGEAIPIVVEIENQKIKADARIKNIHSEDGLTGCGFAFENLSFEAATIIHDYLANKMLSAIASENDEQ